MASASEKPWWERCESSLRSRSWLQVRDLWIQSAPIGHEPGRLPESSVEDMPNLQSEARAVAELKEDPKRAYLDDVTGLRPSVLLEGIALLHKAANVVAAGQNNFGT